MANDDTHAERLRRALAGRRAISERKMFGGICFMLRDHMLCTASKRGFMFRVGTEREAEALARPGARIAEMRGRRMHGFLRVDPAQCRERDLARWIALAQDYVASLPAKSPGKRKREQTGNKAGSKKAPLSSARRSRNPPAK